MKKNLTNVLRLCIIVVFFALLFPFRTAEFKLPNRVDSSASLGPTFIFTSPKKHEIYNAIFEADIKSNDNYQYFYAMQSRLDYGRTLMLMAPFIAGALGSFFWIRKLEMNKNSKMNASLLPEINIPNSSKNRRKIERAESQYQSKKAISSESISQLQQYAASQVCYGTAKYRIVCPRCKDIFLVYGKSLRSKDSICCPYSNCRRSMSTSKLSVELIEGQILVYKRITHFFSYDGRISVGDYWLSVLIVSPVLMIVKLFMGPISPLVFFLIIHPLVIKRYHDHGMRRLWCLIQLFAAFNAMIMAVLLPSIIYEGESYPIFGVIYGSSLLAAIVTGIMISFIPSKKGINRYGPPTSQVKKAWT